MYHRLNLSLHLARAQCGGWYPPSNTPPHTHTPRSAAFICHSPCVPPPRHHPSWGNPTAPTAPTATPIATHTLFGCNFPWVFDEALTHHAESPPLLSDWSGGLGNLFHCARWVVAEKKLSPFQISTLTVTTPNPLPSVGKCLSITI